MILRRRIITDTSFGLEQDSLTNGTTYAPFRITITATISLQLCPGQLVDDKYLNDNVTDIDVFINGEKLVKTIRWSQYFRFYTTLKPGYRYPDNTTYTRIL